MIKVAAKPPHERMGMSRFFQLSIDGCSYSVSKWRTQLRYESLPKVRDWGVEVQSKMMQVQARVLNPPSITYGANKSLRAQFG